MKLFLRMSCVVNHSTSVFLNPTIHIPNILEQVCQRHHYFQFKILPAIGRSLCLMGKSTRLSKTLLRHCQRPYVIWQSCTTDSGINNSLHTGSLHKCVKHVDLSVWILLTRFLFFFNINHLRLNIQTDLCREKRSSLVTNQFSFVWSSEMVVYGGFLVFWE